MPNDQEVYENPSRTRPPQLNKTVCGCRCGRVNGSFQEANRENDDDAASTLVASDASDNGEDHPARSDEAAHDAGLEIQAPTPSATGVMEDLRASIRTFLARTEGFQHLVQMRELSLRPCQNELLCEFEDADSMYNEPGSDINSVVPPDGRSVHSISPGPGLGAWTEKFHYPLQYHFLARPLRLTPQHQYCRGRVASHLVLRDRGLFEEEGPWLY